MTKKNLFLLPKIILWLIIGLLEIIFCTNNNKNHFDILGQWDVTKFTVDGRDQLCYDCIPSRIKLTKNGTIFCSFPRYYNTSYNVTFAEYINDDNLEGVYFLPWPTDDVNVPKLKSTYKIYSIMGFEIDDEDNFYLLDQGIINETGIVPGTQKLVIVDKNRGLKDIIYFGNSTTYTSSLFNDIVIDFNKKFAYISDSGYSLKSGIFNPSIIVINLVTKKIYKLFDGHKSLMPDFALSITNGGKVIRDSLFRGIGVNGLALSCDGDAIFFSPLKSRMIYSIYTKDIQKIIKNPKEINDIEVHQGYKNQISDGLLISSKGNLYMTNVEERTVNYAIEVDQDLLRFDFKDFSEIDGRNIINWPSGLDIHGGNLYLLDNRINTFSMDENSLEDFNEDDDDDQQYNRTNNFTIFKYKVGNDEYPYKQGCTNFFINWKIGSIVIWICFGLIVLFVLVFAYISTNEEEEDDDFEKKNQNLTDNKEETFT